MNAVHDSILLEVPDKRTGEAARLIREVMELAGDDMLKVVPCLTEVKVGKDWSFRKRRSGLGAIFQQDSLRGKGTLIAMPSELSPLERRLLSGDVGYSRLEAMTRHKGRRIGG